MPPDDNTTATCLRQVYDVPIQPMAAAVPALAAAWPNSDLKAGSVQISTDLSEDLCQPAHGSDLRIQPMQTSALF